MSAVSRGREKRIGHGGGLRFEVPARAEVVSPLPLAHPKVAARTQAAMRAVKRVIGSRLYGHRCRPIPLQVLANEIYV